MTIRPITADERERYRLSNEQRASFFRDGFLGPLPCYADRTLIDELAEFLVRVEREKPIHPLYGRYSTRDWHLENERLRSLFVHPGMIVPLTQLMGEDLLLWRSKAFIKEPFGGEIGWHQEWGSFNGAEVGNDVPALQPAGSLDDPWNVTIWFALEDIDETMGPIRFVRGSHKRHFPVAQVPLPEAAFFEDPFNGLTDPMEIVRKAQDSTLILDIDTSHYFDGVEVTTLTFEQARQVVLTHAARQTGEVALPFEIAPSDYITLPMAKGQFVIFYERVMHGSGASTSSRTRAAVNCRVTPSMTLVYPQRLQGKYIDGSNLNIKSHYCIPLCGTQRNPNNAYAP
ncbi:MAG TPA: phytanoyl-CoA dioxygenase family protein [Pseudomonadota bacterium]|nr:phytanoyl-CoA dioxygenase family protein [Pseudomonadota bacterium]